MLWENNNWNVVQKWLVLPLPTPINNCERPEQATQPSCRPTPYPVVIIRQPVTQNQVGSCARCS